MAPEPSDPFQRFKGIEKISDTSFGELLKGNSKDGPVLLKVIDLEKTEDDLEELLQQADIQSRCESSHIGKYFGSWYWSNKITIATEYLGGTLEELVIKRQD